MQSDSSQRKAQCHPTLHLQITSLPHSSSAPTSPPYIPLPSTTINSNPSSCAAMVKSNPSSYAAMISHLSSCATMIDPNSSSCAAMINPHSHSHTHNTHTIHPTTTSTPCRLPRL